MADIFDYLKWRGDISMEAVPLGDADRLILAELVYVDFDNELPMPIGELCEKMLRKIEVIRESGAKLTVLHHKEDEELLKALMRSPRFCELKLGHCRQYHSKKHHEQFAAMTVLLPDNSVLAVFRGTDWSLVGWKEDFDMCHSTALPSQLRAVEYLTDIGMMYGGEIRVTGHSKGGNLAVYAAAFSPEHIRGRVCDIVSLDGPGFCEAIMASDEYRSIAGKAVTYMPDASIVGTLFSKVGKFSLIKSRRKGVLQHIPYNWEIMGAGFVTSAQRDSSGALVEDALNDWIYSMTPAERKVFIDTVWSIFADTDIDELDDILDNKNARQLIKKYNSLGDDARELISDTLAKLRAAAKASLRELLREARTKGKNKE